MEEFKNSTHILTKTSLLHAQVCSSATYEEALAWLQINHPAGTTNNWQRETREELKPVKCAEFPDRMHYIFTC